MAEDLSASLLPTLRDRGNWFRSSRTPYVVIGGVAVSLVGRARITRDVDAVAVIDDSALSGFVASGLPFGFAPRITDPVGFARSSCMLLMAHRPEGVKLDLALARSSFEVDAINRGISISVGGADVRVPCVEDLIIMKAISARPIDFADIDTLLDMNPKADRRKIRRLARFFSDLLEDPEVATNTDRLLKAKRVPQSDTKKRRR